MTDWKSIFLKNSNTIRTPRYVLLHRRRFVLLIQQPLQTAQVDVWWNHKKADRPIENIVLFTSELTSKSYFEINCIFSNHCFSITPAPVCVLWRWFSNLIRQHREVTMTIWWIKLKSDSTLSWQYWIQVSLCLNLFYTL